MNRRALVSLVLDVAAFAGIIGLAALIGVLMLGAV